MGKTAFLMWPLGVRTQLQSKKMLVYGTFDESLLFLF